MHTTLRVVRGSASLAGLCCLLLAAELEPARASCSQTSWFFNSLYSYVYTPGVCPSGSPCPGATSVTPAFEGAFWALGYGDPSPGAGADNGAWPALEGSDSNDTGWAHFSLGEPTFFSGLPSADTRTDGCMASAGAECMTVLLGDQLQGQGYFAILTDHVDAGGNLDFARPASSPIDLAAMPRPQVSDSTSNPNGLELRFAEVPSPFAGVYLDPACSEGVLLGYKIYQRAQRPGEPTPTDRSRSGWAVAVGGDGPGGAPRPFGSPAIVTLSPYCSRTYYFALSLIFDGGFETPHLSGGPSVPGPIGCTDYDCDRSCSFSENPEEPLDCDDGNPRVFPYAPQVCDHLNNDCTHPSWPDLAGTNEEGPDLDGDSWTGACDNCPQNPNPSQHDLDADGTGDACDLDDGEIVLAFAEPSLVEWQEESGFESWNLYRGSLEVLKATDVYTQAPGSNPLARRECGLAQGALEDLDSPGVGQVAFYLVTGTAGSLEGSLGEDSAGNTRPNASPCP